ncbi:NAD(P)-binding protein [Aureobasidium sp. EXF-8845]|nr:NAD(P)-binding protein [Aureobasidium sp. EXF-8845]KAI4857936.1 NAD(P)-binding protein [Aureobasidium sp. EXF-8846]
MAAVSIAGSTGLVGSHILTILKQCSQINRIHAFSRKDLPTHPKLVTINTQNPSDWLSAYPKDTSVFITALGTTARIAGSIAAQRKIDYDLNLSLAKSAKASGVETYVLISTSGASPTSRISYAKMKGELDEAVQQTGFEHVIVLKPGLLVGTREDSRPGEFMGRSMATFLGSLGQDADVVARAAVSALLDVMERRNTQKVRVLNQQDVIRLGRTEWKGFN